MRTILVTGATGFLGRSLVTELLKKEEFRVIAIAGRHENAVNLLPHHPRLKMLLLTEWFSHFYESVDTVINCAFARSNESALLAQAMDFTEKLVKRLEDLQVKSVINISTQGVYKRLPVGELSDENSPIAPIDLYSMSKYASEKMLSISAIPFVTNVRLASLMMPQRFLYFFVQKAMKREIFTVTAPNQYVSLLDVTDAASGLAAITTLSPANRASVYNLGIGIQYSLLEYAEGVQSIGNSLGYNVHFEVVDKGSSICSGMDCSRLLKDTGWNPSILMNEMIMGLFANTIVKD